MSAVKERVKEKQTEGEMGGKWKVWLETGYMGLTGKKGGEGVLEERIQ